MKTIQIPAPIYDATLAWCNANRIHGLPPAAEMPVGQQNDGASCPCHKLTHLFVTRDYAQATVPTEPRVRILGAPDRARDSSAPRLPIPPAVHDFVELFDEYRAYQASIVTHTSTPTSEEARPVRVEVPT